MAQACAPLQLVYARATTEPPQNYGTAFDSAAAKFWSKGYGAAGYSLLTNTTVLVPGATGWPVHYPASWGGPSPREGVSDMLRQLGERSRACPSQRFALGGGGGHSQGGFVTADAIPKIPADVLAKVVAVTIFGGPACPSAVQGRCISYCQAGDSACARGGKGGPKGIERRRAHELGVDAVALAEMAAVAPNCAQLSGLATTGLGKGGHLGYNADGTYVRAAACFIAAKFGR